MPLSSIIRYFLHYFLRTAMHKHPNPDKENTTATFYQTQRPLTSQPHYASTRKQLDTHSHTFDQLTIEAETLLHKLTEKIGQDENKIQKNYLQLNELNQDIEQHLTAAANDKEIDHVLKAEKETIKALYSEDREVLGNASRKYGLELKNFNDSLSFTQKQLEYEKDEREDGWGKMIDQFEREIGDLEKEFKSIRNREEDSLEQGSLQLYHLEEEFNTHIEGETAVRKQEHETIIRLVAECIEKIRYIY